MANYNRSQHENDWGNEGRNNNDYDYENERNYVERRRNQSSNRSFDYDYDNDRTRNRGGQSFNNPDYDRQNFGGGRRGDTDWDFDQNRNRGGNWGNENQSDRGYGSSQGNYGRSGSSQSDYGRSGSQSNFGRSGSSQGGEYGRFRDRGFRAGGNADYYGRDRGYTGSDFQQDFGGPSSESYDYGRRSGWGENDSGYGRSGSDYNRGNTGSQGNWGQQSGSSMGHQGEHYGRGPQGYQRSDDRIREDINDRLTWHGDIDATMINVTVKSGDVTLEGTVPHRHQKRMAEELAEQVQGVNDVQNRLRVQNASNEGSTGSSGSSTSGGGKRSTTAGSTAKKANERENDQSTSMSGQIQNSSMRERTN